jgi:hypothetical protein
MRQGKANRIKKTLLEPDVADALGDFALMRLEIFRQYVHAAVEQTGNERDNGEKSE